jgi:hypothetical protein
MLCSLLSLAGRWPKRTTLPGWLALRLWLVLGLMTPALGLGGWVHPASVDEPHVAEPGVHAPPGHANPAERPHELPLRSEAEDAEDSKDDLRKRSSTTPLGLPPGFDLQLAAAVAGHRFADPHDGGPGCTHRDQLHNRGPPRA